MGLNDNVTVHDFLHFRLYIILLTLQLGINYSIIHNGLFVCLKQPYIPVALTPFLIREFVVGSVRAVRAV